jgi:hypothetical protein
MTNLITNGSFEINGFESWDNAQTDNTLIGSPGYASDHCVFIGNSNVYDTLCSQTISTNIGSVYILTYRLRSPNSDRFMFDARLNGVVVPGSVIDTTRSFPWTQYSFNFIATDFQTTLSFMSFVNPSYPTYARLDTVSVVVFLAFTQIVPDNGPTEGKNTITLHVENFNADTVTYIDFGGITITDCVFVNSTTLKLLSPPHLPGTVDITIHTNTIYSLTFPNAFTYYSVELPTFQFTDSRYIEFSAPTLGVNYLHDVPRLPPSFSPMSMLFSDNSLVVYKSHSLASGGVGTVKNTRSKSKKT